MPWYEVRVDAVQMLAVEAADADEALAVAHQNAFADIVMSM